MGDYAGDFDDLPTAIACAECALSNGYEADAAEVWDTQSMREVWRRY